jgi:hypothetical protein
MEAWTEKLKRRPVARNREKATRKTSGLPKLGPNGTQRIEDCDPKLCEKVCCLSSKRGCFYANYYQHTYCRITEKRKQEILVEKQRR